MKISIVTVCFNSVRSIADTLASVDAQTHPDIEHLLIDGASRDGTMNVIGAHARKWRRAISEPDRGIYDAMNKGLAQATGEFVGFLNADDTLVDPDAIARLAEAATNTTCDALYSDVEYVRANDVAEVVRHWRSGNFSRDRLARGWMPPHPTFYVRRALLASVGRFDADMRIAGDYDFMLRVLTRPSVSLVHVPGVMVRMRMGGASNRSPAALWRKSVEDLIALRRNRVGGLGTLVCKNLRKLPQFVAR